MKPILSLFFAGICSLLFVSCINEEGEGGTASVDGFVYKIVHPDGEYNFTKDTFPAARTDVYIQYGNQKPYGDKMDIGPDGYFKFKYLMDGNYIVFAYNKYPNGYEEAVFDTVYVHKGKNATTKDIYIHEGKMFGKSFIKGTILAEYYDKNVLIDSRPAVDQRVYIRKKGSTMPFDDVRAGTDGTFIFEKLAVGEYQIYGISETEDRVLYVRNITDVKVTEKETMTEISDPIIIRLRS
ncbi:hypothetical protein [Proteiniphilum sp.]|nr:hypothetical protein [Proteiniphilum sp.]MEA4918189.1 hypothetical protein [Proteiniphilum sp.]